MQPAAACRTLQAADPSLSYSNQPISVAPEREGSSPHSQQPANGPYPEQVNPHPPRQSPLDPF
jgi:hypothetical protein